jgi:hypothetical protein
VSIATGLVSAKPEVLQLCRSLTASEWQIFCLARFPYAMPYVFAGLKVAVTMAMIGVIVGEFITAQAGLGYIIMFASSAGETATVLAAIVLLCGVGLVLFGLVALAEKLMQRWYGGRCRLAASSDREVLTMRTASLPMAICPRCGPPRAWEALRGILLEAGLRDAGGFAVDREAGPDRIGPKFSSQTCGYPLRLSSLARRCGSALPAPTRRAAMARRIVRSSLCARDPGAGARRMKGGMFLLNSPVSNSGMNLPRRALAEIAAGKPFFRGVVETGGHPASLDRLLRGEGDVASIDCVPMPSGRDKVARRPRRVRIIGGPGQPRSRL